MAINYTTLLGLAQPVTGTEANTWGDVVNDSITALLDSAIAGTATISLTAGNVTLTDNDGTADQARMAILVLTGTPGTTRNVVAPSRSKTYIVINQSDSSAIVKGSATTGVTVRAGQAATCVWNGTDFEIVASGDVDGPASATDNAVPRYDGTTGKLIQNSGVTIDDSNNVSGVVQLNATTVAATTGNITTVNATTVDTTNIEVTSLKAKDGTAAGSIADSTGVVTLASSVLTTTDINGGTIDGTVIGGSSAAAGTFTTATATTGNITTVNATTVDTTNLEVTNLKAKDGTASATIADSTGIITVSTQLNVDNININGNTISSTDTNGNIILDPNGTGFVQEDVGGVDYNIVSQVDIGTAPNEIPLNQYLGNLAYQNAGSIAGPVVVGANSSTDAFRITQTGSGNALLVEDEANPDSSPFVVDSIGRVLVGTSTALNVSGDAGFEPLQVTTSASLSRWSSASSGPNFNFAKSRGATPSINTIVQNSDSLGSIGFNGADGASFILGARIQALVDGTPGTNDMPGRLVFSTTADGASSPTERMRIDNAGRVGVGVTPSVANSFRVARNITGSAFSNGISSNGQVQSDVTSRADYFISASSVAAGTYPLITGYYAQQGTFTGTVTSQYGFGVDVTLTGATNNYGLYSNIASGTGRWNFYAAGSANNYFAGNVGIGTTSPAVPLQVNGALRAGRDTTQYISTTGDGFGNYITAVSISGNAKPFIIATDSNSDALYIRTPNARDIVFETNNTRVVTMKSAGQVRFVPLAAAPAGAEDGDVYYNSTTNKLQVRAAGAWVDLN